MTGRAEQIFLFRLSQLGNFSVTVDSFLRDRTPQPQEVPLRPAEDVWGKASNFSYASNTPDFTNDPIVPSPPSDPPPDDPTKQKVVIDYDEVWRKEKLVKITSDSDPSVFVEVARIEQIVFKGPNTGAKNQIETYHRFTLHYPESEDAVDNPPSFL